MGQRHDRSAAGATAWEAAAEANAAAVDVAGEYYLDNTGGNGLLTYFNQGTGAVTALTITGLDVAVAVAGNLTFTA